MSEKITDTDEIRHPIKLGGFKIFAFGVILVLGVATFEMFHWHPVWTALYVILLFAGIKVFHPEGWTDFLREWKRRNVRGYEELFWLDTDGSLHREIVPCLKINKRHYSYRQPDDAVGIVHRLSGWRRGPQTFVTVGPMHRTLDWEIVSASGKGDYSWPGVDGDSTIMIDTVLLQHPDQSRLHFPLKEALNVIKALAVYEEASDSHPFPHRLQDHLSYHELKPGMKAGLTVVS